MIAVDGSEISARAAGPAIDLAHALGLRPEVVHAVDPNGHDAADECAHFASAVPGMARHTEWSLIEGRNAADAIVRHARELAATIVAVSTHTQPGLGDAIAVPVRGGALTTSPVGRDDVALE